VPIEDVEGISVASSNDGVVALRVGAGSYEIDIAPG
jgi:hypothetical protein